MNDLSQYMSFNKLKPQELVNILPNYVKFTINSRTVTFPTYGCHQLAHCYFYKGFHIRVIKSMRRLAIIWF